MTFRNAVLAATLALAAAAGATCAQARVMTAVITGSASGENLTADFTDVNGTAHTGNFSDQGFTATFVYDTSRGTELDGPVSFLFGDPPFSPIVYASLTFFPLDALPVTHVFRTDQSFSVFAAIGPEGEIAFDLSLSEASALGTIDDDFQVGLCSLAVPPSLSTPFSGDGSCGGNGSYRIHEDVPSADDGVHFSDGLLTPAHITVTGAGAPEPAGWALMVVGFGGLGAALRRRRPDPALPSS